MSSATTPLFKRRIIKVIVLLCACLLLIQFIRPEIPHPPVTGDLQAPPEVKAILKRACYDCHSNETQLRWYDQLSPAIWRVAGHIKDGRQVLNFSNWQSLSPAAQKGKLFESFNQIALGAMPLKDYQLLHPGAAISAGDAAVIKQYLAGMLSHKPADSAKTADAEQQFSQYKAGAFNASNVQPTINGIAYIGDYKNWQPVSTTDRVDNGTMRVIYGNDVAITALKENNIHPWPNGTVFAKAAWTALEDADGNVRPGAFIQVEFMIKDDKKYAGTEGWGWARWKGPKLTPYGQNILFTTECINCHRPVKNNDLVFTTPIKH
ncbi:heme-binding domain-containing protein [uncultured Chitinophaga sp.]|jgi:hypothetical protein|uniref:heme-binding domain-containing protein n=1 Tax=uncultured Chitinophaga sp. TaxID=339340 RepID=UPI002630F1DC|nr:heme-binding domain-containing protein [uncultured Chitinophaga sp.]